MTKKSRIAGFQTWFLYFWTYCVLGWCYEVFLEVVVYRWGFSNRGFLWGPYLPVYGVGALLILGCLRGLTKKPLRIGRVNIMPAVVFLAVVALTTVVELIASYLLEWTTGGWLWDYTRYAIQWQGRICLSASLRHDHSVSVAAAAGKGHGQAGRPAPPDRVRGAVYRIRVGLHRPCDTAIKF